MDEKLEKILYNIDFSKDTDLKERLAGQLFGEQPERLGLGRPRQGSSAARPYSGSRTAMPLTDDEAKAVSAAMGTGHVQKDDPSDILPPFGPNTK